MAGNGLSDSGEAPTEHLVQLFDDVGSLGESVGAFLQDGWRRGESLLLVARPHHREAILQHMADHGCPLTEICERRQLTVLDCEETLRKLLRGGWPDAARFQTHIGAVVSSLLAKGHGLRMYGEMVDVLAEHGRFAAAVELEKLWNELGATAPFTLLCGYQSGHFGNSRLARALRAICALHTHASAKPTDMLGSWLLGEWNRRSELSSLPQTGPRNA